MRRFSTILLYVTIAFLLLWQLPWCYNFFVVKPEKTPFTLYSFVIGDFAQMGQEEGKGSVRRDLAGNIYSEAAFDSILPMFYFRQLMSDERFPDTIKGIAVTPKMVQTENFNFRSVPSDINAPSIGLYPLMESMSGRVDLKMPDDVFRITSKGIEFIDMASNSVKEDKSLQFTEAMTKKEFRFPATEIVGNPTVKKEYDEGYLLLDGRETPAVSSETGERASVCSCHHLARRIDTGTSVSDRVQKQENTCVHDRCQQCFLRTAEPDIRSSENRNSCIQSRNGCINHHR